MLGMLTIAIIGFLASLIGLAALFFLKHIESKRGVVFASETRMRADQHAQEAKRFFFIAVDRVEQLPHDLMVLFRYGIHIGAIVFARVASAAEGGAHRLADRVSHKHHFERNESSSEFLKTIREHKSTLTAASSPAPVPDMIVVQEAEVKKSAVRKKRVPKPDVGLEIKQ